MKMLKLALLAMSASIGYLTIGLVRGFSSPAIPSMKENNPELTPHAKAIGLMSGIPPLGAMCGSLISGPLMYKLGPRTTLLIGTIVFSAAWTYIGFAPTWQNVVLGRICTGCGVGITLPSAQLYVSDCSPAKIRGMVGSLPALFMAVGILIVYIFGTFLKWNFLAWSCAFFPASLFCLLLFLPESPVWLLNKGREDKAAASLKWLKRESVIDMSEQAATRRRITTSGAPLCSKQVLVPFSLVVVINIFQQVSGINAIVFFTVSIFQESGSTIGEYLATILVGLVQLIATIISIFLVDYFGRKPLLLVSALFMCISMTALGTYFYLYVRGKASTLGLLPLISQLVFITSYSIGYCSIPYILLGELLPLKYRSLLSSISGAINLAFCFISTVTYPIMRFHLGLAPTFWIYAGDSFLSCIFVYFLLPETKGKTLAEIQRHFEQKYPLTKNMSQVN